jgi:hypothetical protein
MLKKIFKNHNPYNYKSFFKIYLLIINTFTWNIIMYFVLERVTMFM